MNAITESGPARLRQSRARRGMALYVTVMGLTTIVSAIGLSAVMVARVQLRMNASEQSCREARRLASSAVENALVVVNTNPDWRTDYVNNVEYPATPATLGDGTYTWKLVDQDGSLDDSAVDAVRIYGIGRLGQQVSTESVQLEPAGSALSCLEVALHSGGDVYFDKDTTNCNQTISSNNNVNNNDADVNANVEAVNGISGSFSGSTTTGITPRDMPAASVFDYYLANGTPIDIYSIPGKTIEKVVLSPGNNPYGGATNSQGIYVIDCEGEKLDIKKCRIEGTLVVLNPKNDSKMDDAIHWEAAVANYPALLYDGDLYMKWHGAKELEESAEDVNFNPAGSPYQGESDNDKTDTYPGVIKGIIYISGNLVVDDQCALEGVVVVGGVTTIKNDLNLTYKSTFLNNPPPGFRSGDQMAIIPGSWDRGPAN